METAPIVEGPLLYLSVSADGGVLFDPDNDRLLKMNPVGAEMWTMLASGMSESDVASKLTAKYGVEVERVSGDIASLLESGRELGLSPAMKLVTAEETSTDVQQNPETFPWYGQDGTKARPKAKRLTVFAAIVGLTIFDFILSALSFAKMCAAVKIWPINRKGKAPDQKVIGQICAAVDRACVWYPKKALCLQRSAVTACILRHYGVAARMVVGVRPMPFLAHAWVEANGSVINDFPKVRKFYKTMTSY